MATPLKGTLQLPVSILGSFSVFLSHQMIYACSVSSIRLIAVLSPSIGSNIVGFVSLLDCGETDVSGVFVSVDKMK